MDAAEAGRNAVKMMLYFTILYYPGKRDESNPLTRKEAYVLNGHRPLQLLRLRLRAGDKFPQQGWAAGNALAGGS